VPDVAAIEIRGLTKSYGDVEAVRGVDLTVETGEVLVLGEDPQRSPVEVLIAVGLAGETEEVMGLLDVLFAGGWPKRNTPSCRSDVTPPPPSLPSFCR
jgi:ABC-type lipopolysaccharide export system ATPase subunit